MSAAEWRTYLLNAVLIALLEGEDLVGALLRVVDLLPSLVLLLLKQSDTIRKQLRVSLNAACTIVTG